MTKQFLILALISGFSITSTFAQSGTITTGGDISGEGGSVSFTIGQIEYQTIKEDGVTISQGIQQPIEITVVSNHTEKHIHLSASVYPNPASNYIVLDIQETDIVNMQYKLFDINGKQINQNLLSQQKTYIQLTELASGIYFLKVLEENIDIKTFKIIKTR